MFKPLVLVALLGGLSTEGSAQTRPVELHAEAVAVGVSLALPTRSAWTVGADVSAGKHIVVSVTDAGDGIDTYATGYLGARWSPGAGWQVSLSPVGAAVAVGNDFGTVYPSARLGASHF